MDEITLGGRYLHLDRQLTPDQIQPVLLSLFPMNEGELLMQEKDIDWAIVDLQKHKFVCEVAPRPGTEFKTDLYLVFLDNNLLPASTETFSVIGQLCQKLECRLLFGHDWDGNNHPLRHFLFHPDGHHQKVLISHDEDYEGIYIWQYL